MALARDHGGDWIGFMDSRDDFAPRNDSPKVPGSRLVADLITEMLAQCDPVVADFDGSSYCALCGIVDPKGGVAGGVDGLDDHDIDCPWRMAKELHP